MKPKVLFINLPYVVKNIDATRPKIRSFFAFPYGLLSIATYCKDLADIRVCDYGNQERDAAIELLKVELEEYPPDIVGFSMGYDNSYGCLEDLAGIVKDFDPNILVVLGGSAASYSYEEIIEEQEDIDWICFGEGEIPFYNILEAYDPELMRYSWVSKQSIEWKRKPSGTFIQNLDEVIDIDYSLINAEDYDMQEAFSPFVVHKKQRQFFLMTSRGCPFQCAFCSNATIHGKKVRAASVLKIIEHVRRLIDDYGLEVLTIYDDQMLIDMPRAKQIFFELAQFNIRIEAPNGFSVRYIDDEMAMLMSAAGMDTVYLAIESGCEYVLKYLIKKPLKLSQVSPAVEHLRRYGFFIHGFFVMGMPGETQDMREETYRFIKDTDLDWAGLNMATPVRGSQLYKDCIKYGWIEKQKISDIVDKKYIIKWGAESPEEIEADVYKANLDINFHHNRRMRIGDYQTAARCFEEVLRRYPGHKEARQYLRKCDDLEKGIK